MLTASNLRLTGMVFDEHETRHVDRYCQQPGTDINQECMFEIVRQGHSPVAKQLVQPIQQPLAARLPYLVSALKWSKRPLALSNRAPRQTLQVTCPLLREEETPPHLSALTPLLKHPLR